VQIGITFPQVELAGDPEGIRLLAATIEDLGFSHLLAFDHVLGAVHAGRQPPLWGPYDESDPFHDPFVLFSFLAGRTERLRFVTGVLVLPQRQTALVAKQAADLAILSGNRLRLGVGIGWSPVEYQGLGQDFSSRADRLDEQVPLLRSLWAERVVTFSGRFDTIDRAACIPRPAAPIAIWMGGWADAALRRAARLADGFIFAGDTHRVEAKWQTMKRILEEEGRSSATFGAEAIPATFEDPSDASRFVERWAEMGGTHVALSSTGLGFDSPQAHVEYVARLAAALRSTGWDPEPEFALDSNNQ